MKKTIWYLVHDLTDMTQLRFRGQKSLINHLRDIGCCFDNNVLPQIKLPAKNKEEIEDEDVGEIYLISENEHEICVERLM
ncbi:MAG: hypothetical protein EOM67_05480 [Spirochaetia bacterium]|nr:hypothetical protein [Spirochaetia bacterium]